MQSVFMQTTKTDQPARMQEGTFSYVAALIFSAVRRAVDEDGDNDGLPDHLDDADLVETRYKGGHIPSKAFHFLQKYVSDDSKELPKKGTVLSDSLCRRPDTLGITKTYLYNFDPFKPHFYIVKLGFTGVYIVFLISAQKQIVGTC